MTRSTGTLKASSISSRKPLSWNSDMTLPFSIFKSTSLSRRAVPLEYEPNRLTLRSPCACAIGVMILRSSSIVYGICVTSQCFSDFSITVFFKKYNRKEFER